MLVISSEGGRFPVGLIIASTFWLACFGLLIHGNNRDSKICTAISTNDFPQFVSIIDGDLNK